MSPKTNNRILFIVPYPLNSAPSQRFRFEQYFDMLRSNGFDLAVSSFLDSQNWQVFFKKGHFWRKAWILVNGALKRFIDVAKAAQFDFVFIHREASPVGPPLFEWLLAKVMKKRIIYDFDDAIWMTDRRDESFGTRLIKYRSKVSAICKWSYKVSCGNEYLQSYAKRFNINAIINPTTIDTSLLHNPALVQNARQSNQVVIGWTGSHSTLKYLTGIEQVLARIQQKNKNAHIVIIADRSPELHIPFTFVKWNEEREVQDLSQIDVGLMPLPDDEWAKGKCGFKALQYMALEIPAVVSPVGVNSKIVTHGKEGFHANSTDEWEALLQKLIDDAALRKDLGKAGRLKVEQYYSVSSNGPLFLSLFA